MVRYTIKVDDRYLLEWLLRYRAQDRLPYRWEHLKYALIAIAVLIAVVAAAFLAFGWWEIALGLLIVFSVGLRPFFNPQGLAAALRKLPMWGEWVSIHFDWEGYGESVGSKENQADWQDFLKYLRLGDGFLLVLDREMKSTRWLPDSALVEGTVDEVGRLFKDHVRGRFG
jgi:hypothetical protein